MSAGLAFFSRPGLLEVLSDLYRGRRPGLSVPELRVEEIQDLVAYFVAIGAARVTASSGGEVAITDKGIWMVELLTRLTRCNDFPGEPEG